MGKQQQEKPKGKKRDTSSPPKYPRCGGVQPDALARAPLRPTRQL